MRSKMSELVEEVGKVGTEVDHGDRDVVRPRMLVWKIERATVNGDCGPLWFTSGGRRSGGIESNSGRTWKDCQVLRSDCEEWCFTCR